MLQTVWEEGTTWPDVKSVESGDEVTIMVQRDYCAEYASWLEGMLSRRGCEIDASETEPNDFNTQRDTDCCPPRTLGVCCVCMAKQCGPL